MNLEGDELHKITVNLDDNLTKEDPLAIVIGTLLEFVKIPDLGGLLGSYSKFLPQNLTTLDAQGVYSLLDPQALQQALSEGIEQVTGEIRSQIEQKLNSLISSVEETVDSAVSAAQSLISAGLSIDNINLDYLTNTAEQFFKSFNITGPDLTSISNIGSSASSAINSVIDNLSDREIRDLVNPEFYQQVLNSTLSLAQEAITSNAVTNAIQQIAPSLSINSMVSLAQAGVSLFNTPTNSDGGREPYEILVEVGTYYGKGDGADSDAAQKKSVSGRALQSGKSCGVDNSLILIGSTVQTSLGTFTAVDKTKKASSTGIPVVDLYFETKEEAVMKEFELSSSKKTKQIVKVTPPGGGSFTQSNIQKRGTDYDLY